MENRNPVFINEGDTLTPQQRRVLEDAIRRCNSCKHCDFSSRSCCHDAEHPVKLNIYTGATGYILLIKPRDCENYEWRIPQNEE